MPRRTPSLLLTLFAVAALLFAAPSRALAAKPPPGQAVSAVSRGEDPNAQGGLDAGNAIQAGNNLGAIIKSWGAALLFGIAGFMGVAAVLRRNVAEGLTLMVLVALVGGFIFADGAVRTFVQSLWGAFGLGG